MRRITLRESIRHALHAASLDGLLIKRRAARGLDVEYLFAPDRRQVFAEIYRRGIWVMDKNDKEPVLSGAGSKLDATARIRVGLPEVLARIHAKSLVDIGCGDFTWMRHVPLGVTYIGIDIVPSLIETNQRLYGSVTREFRCIDAVVDPLPRADAVLCREVLFHLSFADARALLENVKASGARHLIATTDLATGVNADIRTGDFRLLNLRRRPFRFPAPDLWIKDDAVQADRGLGVWRIGDS